MNSTQGRDSHYLLKTPSFPSFYREPLINPDEDKTIVEPLNLI